MKLTKEKYGNIPIREVSTDDGYFKIAYLDDILDWIQSMEIGGAMTIAQTEELKAQRHGELMMLKKMRFALSEGADE